MQDGSGIEDGKYRIYEQFQRACPKARTPRFSKRNMGLAAHIRKLQPAGSMNGTTEKESRISRGSISSPTASITLSWNKAAKRIAELIQLDRYLSPKEKEHYPAYLEQAEEMRQRAAEAAAAREILSRAPQKNTPAKKKTPGTNTIWAIPSTLAHRNTRSLPLMKTKSGCLTLASPDQ
ncbi:MAG: hypothetical protein ACLRR6_05080 [Oscillospiraceae bacterium]